MATAYMSGGERHVRFPAQQSVLYHCEPEYVELPGWREDITGVRSYGDLPGEARAYIEYIREALEVPIGWVSVGPERSQLIEIS
jgi:adenylosuccinate synthase